MASHRTKARVRTTRPGITPGRGFWRGLARSLSAMVRFVWRALKSLYQGIRWLLRTRLARFFGRHILRGLRWLGLRAKQAMIALGRFTGRYPRHTFGATLLVFTLAPLGTAFHPLDDNPAELDCLALNIYHEARGEPQNGKMAVGHVVLNRMLDRRFPDSACAVIKQGGEAPAKGCQFSWWCDGRNDQPLDRQAWAESQDFAGRIFDRTVKDPTDGALWYHADYVAPYWRKSLVEGPKIGSHIFYRSE